MLIKIIYCLIAFVAIGFGLMYIFRKKCMPYHEDAVGIPFERWELEVQVLVRALMLVSGGGWLSTGLAIIFMLMFNVPGVFIMTIGVTCSVLTLIATLHVKMLTKGRPPFILPILMSSILILLSLIEITWKI